MDTSDELNMTQVEESQLEVKSSNCCSSTTLTNDGNFLKLDDSTKLIGVQIILILAYSTIILFGVIGNCLVIYVVYKFKNLRTVTNFFIVNLAVADLLVNTLCLPFTLVYTLYGEWMFGQVLCFMLPCAQGIAVHVSTITLNIIALDRHRSIVYHMETKMSKDMCAAVIVITWAVSALLASPLAIFREYGTFDFPPDESIQVCTEKWPGSNMNGSIYSISMLLVQYGLPLAINSVAYIRIWNKLKNHMACGGRNDRNQRKKKTTKMLLTMVVVFAISWLPLHAFQLAVDIDSSVLYMNDFKLLFTVFHIVAMCSTFVNPILYGWMNNNYRTAFLSVFKCQQPFSLRSRQSRQTQKEEDAVCTVGKSTNV
ncbi:neuropeptide Y receptor type 2 [Scomber scombrus]|nr:neuropeptide Y receptor type 2 [Scomber scombrus]